MMRISQAAQALGARYSGTDAEFHAVSTDSRAIRRGDLFVALKGERFDGHAFLAQAAAAGAAAAMVEESGFRIQDGDPALPLIFVENTLLALGRLAQYWRSKFTLPLVALTGSNGKTTVKEMLAAILREAVVSESRVLNPESLEDAAMARKLGVWVIGARGAVATCAMAGARAISRGISTPVGLVTEARDFAGLGLVGLDELTFGGHEIRSEVHLPDAAKELRDVAGILPHAVYEGVRDDLAAIDANVRKGTCLGCGETIRGLTKGPVLEEDMSPRAVVARIGEDMREFQSKNGLESVVVVNLSSTEPYCEKLPGFYGKAKALRAAITEGAPGLTAGVLYAYAAFECGFPYVNFTPSLASDVPALQEMALEKKLPHGGKDGKTGETLLKTALAPMFVARNFNVMSWEGYNIFGNRDAVVLDNPKNNEAKTRGKDRALRQIFGDPKDLHTRVRIDYVPSLDDWKTAWDFIHFRGFLGT